MSKKSGKKMNREEGQKKKKIEYFFLLLIFLVKFCRMSLNFVLCHKLSLKFNFFYITIEFFIYSNQITMLLFLFKILIKYIVIWRWMTVKK